MTNLNNIAVQLHSVAVNVMTTGHEVTNGGIGESMMVSKEPIDSSIDKSMTIETVQAMIHTSSEGGVPPPSAAVEQGVLGQPMNHDEIDIITIETGPSQSEDECDEPEIGWCKL